MKILICVKQVPDTTEIRIDPVTNSLIRAGVPSILNPFDGYALEAAARIRDKHPDTEIIVVSMGPEQASAALRDCLSIAADRAYLVCGRIFSGSDTLATSYILSQAIRKIEEREGKIDAIFCGKQAIDGDTAQVGPEIAEHLGYPQVTYGLEAEVEGTELQVRRETESGYEIVAAKMPCLVTFTKPVWEVRYPTIAQKLEAEKAEIIMLEEDAFPEIDRSAIGLAGSPTRVKKTFVPQRNKQCKMISGETGEEIARTLLDLLEERTAPGTEAAV
ncbi:MAG: electron transfer flavoprotein subunit beta/FixA family protein [Lachnospiraceae bacterium]|nr:electron transfer flavoprotein subunit beta/FixA family protein [Lachnospiraceae bacterium]